MEPIETLIERAQAPDAPLVRRQAAFSALVERFQDVAYGCAYALLGDPHLAQDATQEAFLTAYCHLGELRPRRLRRTAVRATGIAHTR